MRSEDFCGERQSPGEKNDRIYVCGHDPNFVLHLVVVETLSMTGTERVRAAIDDGRELFLCLHGDKLRYLFWEAHVNIQSVGRVSY